MEAEAAVDLRPWVVMPGLIDLHAHLPQLPNAGVGAGLHLLAWLERYIFPLEREFDEATAERVAPAAFRAFARAGTTTVVAYGAIWQPSLDACFRAAEAHGIRAVLGKVMMDRLSAMTSSGRRRRCWSSALRQSMELCQRWHGADEGRLSYAFSPRFAVSCSAEMLAESARLARETGAYWQTHLSEDVNELAEVARLFPDASDYTDVYDRAGGLRPGAILAHAVHLVGPGDWAPGRERGGDRALSGLEPVPGQRGHAARPLPAGRPDRRPRLGCGGRTRRVAVQRDARGRVHPERAALAGHGRPSGHAADRVAAPGHAGRRPGARAGGRIGSVEAGKEADLIVVDPATTLPLGDAGTPGQHDGPDEILSRLIYRIQPDTVRGAWVRGRLLPT